MDLKTLAFITFTGVITYYHPLSLPSSGLAKDLRVFPLQLEVSEIDCH